MVKALGGEIILTSLFKSREYYYPPRGPGGNNGEALYSFPSTLARLNCQPSESRERC